MTDDTHGSIPENPEPEENFAQEPAAPEGEPWHGDAPVDDFGDEAAAGETATVSEETEQEVEGSDVPETVKKRNILLPAVAAGGGILLLGVLAYWQFGDALHGDQPPSPMVIAQPTRPKPQEPAASITPASTGVAPKTDMAQPAETSPAPAATPAAPVSTALVALPASTAAVVVPTSVKADTTATDSRIATLSSHVEDLQKALQQATQQLADISNKLAASQPATAVQQPNPAIEERLNGIEQKLMQMQQHAAPSPSTIAMADESAPAIAAPVMHPVHHRTVHHKAVKTTAHHRAAEAAPIQWVLRAATPTEAWVAKDASTPELRAVHVGDNLPGIGMVTAIREESGAWVVDGARGTVR